MPLRFTIQELSKYVEEIFPQVKDDFEILEISELGSRVRLKVTFRHLRPGNTVSGPAIFSLVDCTAYMAILAKLGKEALAVTTNCSIDFMRKPSGKTDLIANCEILKFGKALVVADVKVYSEGTEKPVARASITYSIPPKN
ncbi:MAG: thioesterase [Rhodobacteraceae bacterium TMED111]|nr:thioesterase [Marinovum sp.]OUV42448.1 MAG: thioesterase [Rhodobacteraceae bacterium TMED111]|tara:strand:- start:1225 stop:1647 length:423 start_codon:yes stop_codon:yes gene_type:complete